MNAGDTLLKTLQNEGPDAAVKLLFSDPSSTLEPYFANISTRLIANFFDAAIHNTRQVAALEARLLLNDSSLKANPKLYSYFDFLNRLIDPWQLFLSRPKMSSKPTPQEMWMEVEKKKTALPEDLLAQLSQNCPEALKPILLRQWNAFQAWLKFEEKYTELLKILDLPGPICYRPFYPYPYQEAVLTTPPPPGDLLVWVEPSSGAPHPDLFDRNRHLVLYFADFDHFYQIAIQPQWNQLLCKKAPRLYIGDKHPFDIWQIQRKPALDIAHDLKLYMLSSDALLEPYLKLIAEELSKANSEIFSNKTSTTLYALGKRLWIARESRRYGISRSPAFSAQVLSSQWYDVHKERPPLNSILGPEPLDLFGDKLKLMAQKRYPRPNLVKKKLKIAHVVQQLVDGGHAPSKLITALLQYCNCSEFEPILIITEGLHYHLEDYPFNLYASYSTIKRAPQRLEFLRELGIPWFIQSPDSLYDQRAERVAKLLHEQGVDRVIFHGPDVTNLMVAQMCDVPKRILLEHGTLPTYPGFELVIASTNQETTTTRKELERFKTEVVGIPFAHNVSEAWPPNAPKRSDFSLPEEAFIFTTVSNHLTNRLGKEMCQAIAQILKCAPNAFYAPMGPIKQSEEQAFMEFFKREGVGDQVRFLGGQANPSHMARMMQAYLNEFPFGSCLGMLDVMAAGCPVVSMYDPQGPIQAQYAFSFLGPDYVIPSGKNQDYVEWALRLIREPLFYDKCAKHTVECYSKNTDMKAYVRKVEQAIRLPDQDLLKGFLGSAIRS